MHLWRMGLEWVFARTFFAFKTKRSVIQSERLSCVRVNSKAIIVHEIIKLICFSSLATGGGYIRFSTISSASVFTNTSLHITGLS